ncbi:uncharacterized protein SPSK_01052 [Sporothrix schenckii 1099-18]|uniref:Uncharacterized protein n=1 Tax=Sporothrix schenckii 1099-18 TaxID=1397361 RepID=A0A0F2LZF0_SPOSC|nr:uncharacterized protein SPSK_01052 [Sporothrix schenckii 1099-18]KJR81271.1 hypothetical protein SPSK_01052 [Sporothrix schenckii 1099-18]
MQSSKREVFDSDDDGDNLSPLSIPLASPQLSPRPFLPFATTVTTATAATPNLPDTSTSTDPSFFRDVYEEQQRAIGAQLAPQHADLGDNHSRGSTVSVSVDKGGRDPWAVPSSPIEVAGQQRGSYLKRKREEGDRRQQQPHQQAKRQKNVSVVVQLDDLSSGHASEAAKTKKQKTADETNIEGNTVVETISIPLEPLTPSRLHQYPRLLSSSIDDDALAAAHDPSLPRQHGLDLGLETAGPAVGAATHKDPCENRLPQPEDGTQSTIAFTTPSLYNSSGRRVPGSSNNITGNSILRQIKSSMGHDGDVVLEEVAAVATQNATPLRRARRTADLAQIMSSPDIIAEQGVREPRQRNSPLLQEDDEREDDEEGGVDWGEPNAQNTTNSIRGQPMQPQSSVADELSISLDVPAQSEAVHEFDASYDSLKEMRLVKTKTKKKSPKKKPLKKKAVFIAASDDEDEDVVVTPPPADSENDFSDGHVKSKAPGKRKRGPKKRMEKASVERQVEPVQPKPNSTKRPRGRPKRQKAPLPEEETDEDILVQSIVEDEMAYESEQPQTDANMAAPDSESDGEADLEPPTPVKAKGKKGKAGKKAVAKDKKESKAGRGRRAARVDVQHTISQEAVDEKPVLGQTSGNTSATSSVKAEAVDAGGDLKDQKTAVAVKEEEPPLRNTPAPERGLLSTGLNTTASQGRVPYRVGLSKKFRIAPLLKMIRK